MAGADARATLMPTADGPALLDIHVPPAPPWWPPAPGWWWLAAGVLAVLVAWVGWCTLHRLRTRRWMRDFDAEVAAAASPSARLAVMSALLRRAARRRDPSTAALETDAWLAWLDGARPGMPLTHAEGVLLREGPWRPDATSGEVDAVQPRLRARFVDLRMRRR